MEYKYQHVVSKAYLELFECNDIVEGIERKYLHVYDKVQRRFFRRSAKKIATKADYYTLTRNGARDLSIEKGFGGIEARGVEAIRTLLREISEYQLSGRFDLAISIKRALTDFVFIHMLRVPAVMETIYTKASILNEKISKEMDVQIDVRLSKNMAVAVLAGLLTSGDVPLYYAFWKRKNLYLRVPAMVGELITCDNPVVRHNSVAGAGVGHPCTQIWVPLSPRIVLALIDSKT